MEQAATIITYTVRVKDASADSVLIGLAAKGAVELEEQIPENEPEVSQEVQQEMLRRLAHLKAHPESGIPWEEVKKRLRFSR